MHSDVFIAKSEGGYPRFPYEDHGHPMYKSLLRMFEAWELNPDNPFKDVVKPGDTVIIKPNWVTHRNHAGYGIEPLITHSSLIKYIIDFAAKALEGQGTIIVGDAPLQGCDFGKLVELSRIGEVLQLTRKKFPGIDFKLEDWRLTVVEDELVAGKRRPPYENNVARGALTDKDYILVDVGKDSFLEDLAEYGKNFRVAAYKKCLMLSHHHKGKHEYLITKRIQQANLLINVPKMKTHMKAGLTGALKNIVGINGHKEYLPHHTKGAYGAGGDSYQRSHLLRNIHEELCDWFWDRYAGMPIIIRKLLSYSLDALRWGSVLSGGESTSVGSWSGNETIWRTVLDLNHILYFSGYSPRKIMTIVDGIVAGEGQGPLKPMPRPAGVLIAGENPAYIDAVIAKLLGYNISRISSVFHAIYDRRSKFAGPGLADFVITSMLNSDTAQRVNFNELPNLNFKKPKFWKHAESRA